MMNEELKALFYSYNEDDIKLALCIARQHNISPEEINTLFDAIYNEERPTTHSDLTNIRYEDIFNEYLEKGLPYLYINKYGNKPAWDYREWKQEEEI